MLAFVSWYAERACSSSVARRLCSVRAYYAWLGGDDPSAGVRYRVEAIAPKQPFTDAELVAISNAASTARDYAIVRLLIGTGARLCELERLLVEDIDFDHGVVRLRGKGRKQRWVAPGERALSALRVYISERNGAAHGYLWTAHGGRYSRHGDRLLADGIYRVVKRCARRAGVENAYVHRFRTTYASRFHDATGDVGSLQVSLGHARVATTMRYTAWGAADRALAVQRRLALGDRL